MSKINYNYYFATNANNIPFSFHLNKLSLFYGTILVFDL